MLISSHKNYMHHSNFKSERETMIFESIFVDQCHEVWCLREHPIVDHGNGRPRTATQPVLEKLQL